MNGLNAEIPSRKEFVETYGGIYEHSPWVAEDSYDAFLAGAGNLVDLLASNVDAADDEKKLALICAHPELAGRAAKRGELTSESQCEQSGAGIDQCSPEEYQRFQDLNERYKQKFGFPFVMAARNSSRQGILSAFAARLDNDHDTEFETAISEIHKIARLRLQAMT